MSRERLVAVVLPVVVVACIFRAERPIVGREPDPVAAIVERAGRYVEEYQRQFSAIVCEEHQTQRVVKADESVRQQRDLVSDLLLIKVGKRTLERANATTSASNATSTR